MVAGKIHREIKFLLLSTQARSGFQAQVFELRIEESHTLLIASTSYTFNISNPKVGIFLS